MISSLHVKMSFIYSMTSTIWKHDLHGWILKPGILFDLNCTYLYIYINIYIFCESVCTNIWYEWHGCCLVSWLLTEKTVCNDIVLRTPVDVTDANVSYSFPGFDMQVACLFISFRLFYICICQFLSHLPSCFQRYFSKMEVIHCYTIHCNIFKESQIYW